jgi:DNA-binding transcriptional MerR regulator
LEIGGAQKNGEGEVTAAEKTMQTIGRIAERSGVSRDTIRYYEKLGLLPPAARTPSGYRMYPDAAVGRIGLVRNAVRFGFSLKELASFLRAREQGGAPCRHVRAAGERILAAIEQQIAELTTTRDALHATLRDWDVRLSHTPAGRPAHLLEALTPDAPLTPARPFARPNRKKTP